MKQASPQRREETEIHLLMLIPRSLPVPWSGLCGTAIGQAAADAAYQRASMGWTDNTCADGTASCSWCNSCCIIPLPFSSEGTDVHRTPSPTYEFHHCSPCWPRRGILSTSQQENCTTAHCAQPRYSTVAVTVKVPVRVVIFLAERC